MRHRILVVLLLAGCSQPLIRIEQPGCEVTAATYTALAVSLAQELAHLPDAPRQVGLDRIVARTHGEDIPTNVFLNELAVQLQARGIRVAPADDATGREPLPRLRGEWTSLPTQTDAAGMQRTEHQISLHLIDRNGDTRLANRYLILVTPQPPRRKF